MKQSLVLVATLAIVAGGCSRPVAVQPPRATSQMSQEVFASPDGMMAWAEGDTRPSISRLVPDLQTGVWGGQDGELFHFRVRADNSYGRMTYGRPHPAAVWLGDLVRLSDRHLAGRVTTLHLVQRNKDGTTTDLAPGRSPAGAPFDRLDLRDGKLHLHDQLGTWYIRSEDRPEFVPIREFMPEHAQFSLGVQAGVKEAFEAQARGQFQGDGWSIPDGTAYALISRDQLFRFDTVSHTFTLLGHPGLQPIGAVNGQLVARSRTGLTLVDPETNQTKTIPLDPEPPSVFLGEGGWVHTLPYRSIHVLTGEERRYPHRDQDLVFAPTSALIPLGDGQMAGGTNHWGSLFRFDPQTGATQLWGRPIPELGQESGEEVAPIDGLTLGADGFLYAAVGTGARGTPESHLVRLDRSGKVQSKLWLPEPVQGLVTGADGRIYGVGRSRVIVIPTEGQVR